MMALLDQTKKKTKNIVVDSRRMGSKAVDALNHTGNGSLEYTGRMTRDGWKICVKIVGLFVDLGKKLPAMIRDGKIEEVYGGLVVVDIPTEFPEGGAGFEACPAGGIDDGVWMYFPDAKTVIDVAAVEY